jgi:tetratricopeptide (TPR) repeat protein/tRNA A-37 threonylcarbamoyl transferase component Bud32
LAEVFAPLLTRGEIETGLERPPDTLMVRHPSAEKAAGPKPSRFPSIPGYEILDELGRGGMGVVYKARHVKLNRIVALKMISPGKDAGPESVARFRNEVEALARLQHPNIVVVYEVGEDAGKPFFSLEFCPGGNLDQQLGGSPLAPRPAALLARTVARAMQAAHQAHVIHRDLKPGNILLLADGTPKITDFGLAKKLDDQGPAATRTGAVMGTPSYMAPEQAHGKTVIGPAADVYALGAILYEMLTGRPPFKAATVLDTVMQVLHDEAVPVRRLQPVVPRDLETICHHCLHKDPGKRYASAEELADDLNRFLAGEPIRARPVSSMERLVKWTGRNRGTAAALVIAVVAVVWLISAGVLLLVLALLYSRAQTNLANVRAENLERENAELVRQRDIDDSIRHLWDRGKEAEIAGDRDRDHKEMAGAAVSYRLAATHYDQLHRLLEKDRPGHDLLLPVRLRRARVEQALHRQIARADWSDRAEKFLKDSSTIGFYALTLVGQNPDSQREQIRQQAATALGRLGLHVSFPPEEARAGVQRLRDQLEPEQFGRVAAACYEVLLVLADAEAAQLPGQETGERAACARRALNVLDVAAVIGSATGVGPTPTYHLRRARYRSRTGDEKEAGLEQARAAALPPRTALDHFLIALDAYGQGEWERVAVSCREVLRQQPNHFWAHFLRASVHLKGHRAAEAEAELLSCLGSRADIPWPHLALASAHLELGDLAAAEQDFADALARASDPLEQYPILTNRSLLWLRLGPDHWSKARADLRKAIALQPNAHPAYLNLAEVHRRSKEWPEALAALDQAEQRHPGTPALAFTRARVLLESGDLRAARRAFEQTIDREPKGSKTGRLLSSLVELGYLKHHAGEYEPALADFGKALAIDPNYLLAHRQKANTLIALNRDLEAGKVLDQYLLLARDRTDVPKFEIYKTRGLIHARLHENPEAIDVFTRALVSEEDLDTRNRRGWVYLALNSPPLALADFNKVLGRQAAHADALCGRAHALVQLNQLEQALQDADQVLKEGKSTPRLLLGAARVHAWVACGGFGHVSPAPIPRHVRRVVELLEDAVRRQAPEGRASFFAQIRKEPAFASLWRDPGMQQLARTFER